MDKYLLLHTDVRLHQHHFVPGLRVDNDAGRNQDSKEEDHGRNIVSDK